MGVVFCRLDIRRARDRVQLAFSVDDMKAGVSGRETVNGGAEPGRDLRIIDVFDGTKSMGAKKRSMPAGSNRLSERSPIFFSCSVRAFSNCFSSSENASGESM